MVDIETRGRKSNYTKGQKSTSTNKNGKRPISLVLDEMIYNNFKELYGLKSNELIQHFILEMVRLRLNYDNKDHSLLETEIKTYSQISNICDKKFKSIIDNLETEKENQKNRDDEKLKCIQETQTKYQKDVYYAIRQNYSSLDYLLKENKKNELNERLDLIRDDLIKKYNSEIENINYLDNDFIISVFKTEQKRRYDARHR